MRIVSKEGAARFLVGRTIESVDLRPFHTGNAGNSRYRETTFDPLITLDDGTTIGFLVDETETGEYGVCLERGRALKVRHSIATRSGVSFFATTRGGRVAWEGGSDAACDDCGCEIHTGRRNGETDSELKRRLRGKRARLLGRAIACVNCSKEYAAAPA